MLNLYDERNTIKYREVEKIIGGNIDYGDALRTLNYLERNQFADRARDKEGDTSFLLDKGRRQKISLTNTKTKEEQEARETKKINP